MRTPLRYSIPAAVIAATLLLQAAASAHYIWATVENRQVRFALLEEAGAAPSAQFEKYVAGLFPRCGGKALALGAPKEGARYAALPAGQSVVVADTTVGAKERGGESYLLVYHAKGAESLAAAGTTAKAPAELLARRDGDFLVVALRLQSVPVARTEVLVQMPGEEEGKSAMTDAKGEARFPFAQRRKSGFVGIRAMVSEAKSGETSGVKYTAIHHWATLTFPLAEAETSKTVRTS